MEAGRTWGGTDLVVDAVEESRDNGKDGRLQRLHVVRQQANVPLEEAHPGPHTVHHCLGGREGGRERREEGVWLETLSRLFKSNQVWGLEPDEVGPHLDNSLKHVSQRQEGDGDVLRGRSDGRLRDGEEEGGAGGGQGARQTVNKLPTLG